MSPDEKVKYIDGVQAEITRLATIIDAPVSELPVARPTKFGDWLSIDWHEADDGGDEDGWRLSLMRNEGGSVWQIAEVGLGYEGYLIRVLFEEITQKMAIARMVSAGDSGRRTWFAIQEELLGALNETWANSVAEHHARILIQDGE